MKNAYVKVFSAGAKKNYLGKFCSGFYGMIQARYDTGFLGSLYAEEKMLFTPVSKEENEECDT